MTLSIWTVYDHPRDYPNNFVARRFELDRPTPDVLVAGNLADLRVQLEAMHLMCLARHPTDDPVIVETWL